MAEAVWWWYVGIEEETFPKCRSRMHPVTCHLLCPSPPAAHSHRKCVRKGNILAQRNSDRICSFRNIKSELWPVCVLHHGCYPEKPGKQQQCVLNASGQGQHRFLSNHAHISQAVTQTVEDCRNNRLLHAAPGKKRYVLHIIHNSPEVKVN